MKPEILKRIAFAGKSVLWSLCLYVVVMLVFNWDDIKNSMGERNNPMVVINSELGEPQSLFSKPSGAPASIAQHAGTVKSIFILVKVVCGLGDKIGR